MIKVAYICEPQVGGLYTFYREMRQALKMHGVDYRCIPPYTMGLYANTPYFHDEGVDFMELPGDITSDLRIIRDYIIDQRFTCVHVLPGNSDVGTALPSCMPRGVGCVAKIPHSGRGAYEPTRRISDYLDMIVPVNVGLRDDLISGYGIPDKKLRVVYIAVNTSEYGPHVTRAIGEPIRIVYVGRIDDLQKNIFSIPVILALLVEAGIEFRCVVVGSGPDERELVERTHKAGLASFVRFTGSLSHAEIKPILANSDIFLMPTRFEGCPHALIEAMASGCVPVVSRLKGTLDQMVDEGVHGFLRPVGDDRGFAEGITRIARDPILWKRMSEASICRARKKFDIAQEAEAYAEVFREACRRSGNRPVDPIAPETFRPYKDPVARLRSWIPQGLKKKIRTYMARKGRSV